MFLSKLYPALIALTAATSTNCFAESPMECSGGECTIDYSGSSALNLTIPAGTKRVSFSYNGSGRVTVKTEEKDVVIDKLTVDCVGSGRVDLSKVHSREAKIKYRGSNDLNVRVKDKAVVKNSGSGDINVSGTAKFEVSGHGSGKVNREED